MDNRPKTKVYIDGSNVFHAQKKLGWLLDWDRVKNYFFQNFDIVECKYYTGIKDGDEGMKKFLRYLSKTGIIAITKPLKKIFLDKDEQLSKVLKNNFVYKANFDVEMTADILLETKDINEIIIFSGDSDFAYLVRKLKNLGKNVTIFSSRKTISWELKLEAGKVIFIEDVKDKIAKQ